jgi:hypothetical protein
MFDRMITPDAEPIGHVSPYRRIDPSHPGRKRMITYLELMQSGDREPDAAIYRHDLLRDCWILKDGA